MKKLDHESSEAFECTRYSHCGADLDEDSLRSVYVNL